MSYVKKTICNNVTTLFSCQKSIKNMIFGSYKFQTFKTYPSTPIKKLQDTSFRQGSKFSGILKLEDAANDFG